jgi:gluconokinase
MSLTKINHLNDSPVGSQTLKVVVMGVSGCGKSTLAAAIAAHLSGVFIEGDDHHARSSVEKMKKGIPLDDSDRQPWLAHLRRLLAADSRPTVLTCSALKKSYRTTLRSSVPGLRFVFLELSIQEATRRVGLRPGHLFPAALVASQFDALEPPVSETGVLTVEATMPLTEQLNAVLSWLHLSV